MPGTAVTSPFQDAILDKLQYQADSNDCGPYTTASVINALLDKGLDAAELALEMDRPVWRGPQFVIRRVPHWATFPWGMVDVFHSYGLNASWRPFTSLDNLWERLSGNYVLMPVQGGLKPLWAHVMALVKWDPNLGWGFANTQFPYHRHTWIQDDLFRKQWQFTFRTVVEVEYSKEWIA